MATSSLDLTEPPDGGARYPILEVPLREGACGNGGTKQHLLNLTQNASSLLTTYFDSNDLLIRPYIMTDPTDALAPRVRCVFYLISKASTAVVLGSRKSGTRSFYLMVPLNRPMKNTILITSPSSD